MAKTMRGARLVLAWGILIWAAGSLSAGQATPRREDGAFSMIVLPSSYDDQGILAAQMKWVRENVGKMNTVLVIHTGDITKDNTQAEWSKVDESLAQIEGEVPYLVVAGNHESFVAGGKHNGNRDTQRFNAHLPVGRFAGRPWYGGCLDGASENIFFLFDIEGMKLLVLSIEFAPRIEILDWANKVVSQHPDHQVLVATHSYTLSADSKLNFKLDPLKYSKANTNRDEIWERFISKHPNIFLVLSSHYFAVRRETSIGDHGNHVHQVMASYLDDEHKTQGWLRIVRFLPRQGRIQFRTYSPVMDRYLSDAQNRFELECPGQR